MKALPLLFLGMVILSSGCVNLDPQALAMANPLIQQFLEEHPNAEIKITHFSAIQAENIIEQVRDECDNPYIGPKELYRVNITDPDTDLVAVVWVDWEAKAIECAWKLGTSGKETDKPREDQGCEHHAEYMCKAGNIYWFDSCGNKQDKKELCSSGCQEGSRSCSGGDGCKSHAEYKCYGDHVYWFDSCGNKQEKKEYCNEGCDNGFCRGMKSCEDIGGYCVYPIVHEEESPGSSVTGELTGMVTSEATASSTATSDNLTSTTSTTSSSSGGGSSSATSSSTASTDGSSVTSTSTSSTSGSNDYPLCKDGHFLTAEYWCPDKGICCAPQGVQCGSQYEYKCYGDHVYWFDSCGNKEAKKEYCEHGCENGACLHVESECVDSDGGWNIFEKGTCKKGDSSLSDHCNADGTLTEKYCVNGGIEWNSTACPEGYECVDAACVEPAPSCEDSDNGLDYGTAGTVEFDGTTFEDYCSDGTLVEYYCDGGIVKMDDKVCEHGCSDGACQSEATTGYCNDSDGGNDYFTRGEVDPHCEEPCGTFIDSCMDDNLTLIEYYCLDGEAETEHYQCEYGCYDGVCVEGPDIQYCNDSDGGKAYDIAGEVITYNEMFNPPEVSHPDICYTEVNGTQYVMEQYCENGEALEEPHLCPGGCSEGACL